MLTPPVVDLVDVSFRLPDSRELFSRVNLTLTPGDAVAVSGPSGVGKSTLLGIIGGLLQPTTGSATLRAQPTHVAWVLQTLNGLNARTVLDNAALLCRLDGATVPQARQRAAQMLSAVGLSDLAGHRTKVLSGGETQRLAVARALAARRPVLLADEPTNQLDRGNARTIMRQLFAAARDDHRIVIVVTHDAAALPAGATVLSLGADGLAESP